MTEPRTKAGRELLRWFAERFGDPVRQEAASAVTGMARDGILAIEAEAIGLRVSEELGAPKKPLYCFDSREAAREWMENG